MNVGKAFQSAVYHYQTGHYSEAESLCRQIIKKHPRNVDALNLLGLACYHMGSYDPAIQYIKRALDLNPFNAEALTNLGNAYRNKGQLDKAISSYEKAIKLKPHLAMAHNNLGSVLQEQGRFHEAAECYRKSLRIDPNNAMAYNNMGSIFLHRRETEEAISHFRKAIALNPKFARAYYSLASALSTKGLTDEAIQYYQKALELDPDFAEGYYDLGIAFQHKGLAAKAIACYEKCIQLNPGYIDAYLNLGILLSQKGELDPAIALYQKALELDPNRSQAYNNMGNALVQQKQYDEAIARYYKAIGLDPGFADAYLNLGDVLREQGRQEEAIGIYEKTIALHPGDFGARFAKCISQIPIIYSGPSQIQTCRDRYLDELKILRDEASFNTPEDLNPAADAVGRIQPFYLACQGLNDREPQQLYGDMVCRIMALRYPQFAEAPDRAAPASGEPLRIGMVSAHFYRHSVWKIPSKGWIVNLNRERFKLYGYYTRTKRDDETQMARQYFDRFIDAALPFEELCTTIRDDNLHVLVYPEIGMDPATLRLASLRLAPVQCSSLGHPDTSGLPTIDYYLSSDLMEPPDGDDHYTERLVRLPNLSVYYTPLEVDATGIDRDTFGLRQNSVLYLCSHVLFTHLPQYDEVYPRIAEQVGDCTFLFIAYPKSSLITEQFRMRMGRAFERFHLDADQYVVILPYLDVVKYYAINRLSDVFLDTPGWSANNSTFEAVTCDLPSVTLPGSLMRQRHCAGILTMMGLSETIASSIDEYVALAVRLGCDREWRRHISEKIAQNKHRTYRDTECIAALEDFLEKSAKGEGLSSQVL